MCETELCTFLDINYNENMRNISIAQGEHYHVFNRGNNKQLLFLDKKDYARFLFLIIYFQSPIVFTNISRKIDYFVKNGKFDFSSEDAEKIAKQRYVEVINFVIMPNHFHITLSEFEENGTSKYMQRVLCAYTKYFNTKYQKSGHVFQGPYKAVHIKDNNQLLYLSTYIHRNPREINDWKDKEHSYPWSSYKSYTQENQWGKLLMQDLILDQFSDKKGYDKFVKSSSAKLLENLDEDSLNI